MNLSKLADLPLTYAGVGATSGPLPEDFSLPEGYDHTLASARIGSGRDRFEQAADALMHWGMQRGAGLRVDAIDEPDRRGFAVGTLPAEVSAFSRPATWWSKAGSPVASRTQRIIANRYLNAL